MVVLPINLIVSRMSEKKKSRKKNLSTLAERCLVEKEGEVERKLRKVDFRDSVKVFSAVTACP